MNTLIAALHGRGSSDIEAILICFLIAALIGGGVYAVVRYVFKQAWAGTAGALTFLVVLLLCFL